MDEPANEKIRSDLESETSLPRNEPDLSKVLPARTALRKETGPVNR